MEFIRQIERLQLLNKLVREQRTGSPEELAERLGISRRQLYVYLEYFKDLGVEIQFSRRMNSFVFANQKQVHIDWKFEILEHSAVNEVVGGAHCEEWSMGTKICTQNSWSFSNNYQV
ncbi:MAG: HTH domain-containing protein [Mongoliibacter sp.]|uniref:HTH domain-containing protein n=1 Tax=Mongoliibacter sp. TaxID=2022438 RepID=UPI0012F052AE|nr:HTH domain-containing protein [Mongoliibacter sp.]TVP54235.1 MAG: HTH domain-containing protein [Mongoliibacter sp.]